MNLFEKSLVCKSSLTPSGEQVFTQINEIIDEKKLLKAARGNQLGAKCSEFNCERKVSGRHPCYKNKTKFIINSETTH